MNKLDELLKLKELLDLGIITDNDFNRKKAELLSDSNTGQDNSDSIKEEEIIIGENEKVCPSCKCIIEKESGACNFCDYDFIKKKIYKTIDNQIDNNNLKKYIPIFFVIILFIFIGTWFFGSNNSEKIEIETPKVATPVSEKPTSLIIEDSISLDSLSKMANAPAAESFQNSEIDDNGEKIYKNWEDYKVGPKNINCNQGIHTESKWISVADFGTLNVTTFQHRFYDKSRIYDQNNILIWEWKGESVQDTTWYLREHEVDISGNDKVKIEFYQGYSSPFCNGYLEVNFGKY